MKTTMIRRITLLAAVASVGANSMQAQNDSAVISHKPSIMVGVAALKFTGDVGKQTDLNPLLDTRLGYYVMIEQRFKKIFGIAITGMYGELQGNDNSKASHANFRSTVMQGELMLTANFDKVLRRDPKVSPFFNVGIGYMQFSPMTDALKGNPADEIKYYYWSDGSIKDQPQSTGGSFGNDITRDYTYETDALKNTGASKSCLTIPVGGGLNFHFTERWTSSVGVNYNLTMSDYLDGVKNGGNDSYIMANVGVQYEFRKRKDKTIHEIDFNLVDHWDQDGDGVGDDKDDCLGTPKGVLVDSKGCPFDTDGDGVPDYQDKEPKSKKGAIVDGNGVTVDTDEMAKRQLDWDKNAVERNEKFNNAPSEDFLKGVDKETEKKENLTPIPDDLKEADFDKNGRITADEITRTIDAFFDGSNDFTVDYINRLIDFFFEQ